MVECLEHRFLDIETCQPQAVEEGISQVSEFHGEANQEGAICREIRLQLKQFRHRLGAHSLSPQPAKGGGASVAAGPRRAYGEGSQGGQACVGPRGGAIRGPYGGGEVVRTMPVGARAVAIAGANSYVASGVYYKRVYEGSGVVCQEVPDPE